VDFEGRPYPLEDMRGRRIAAFCGIGNPAGFRHTLEALGCQAGAWREFPDHHNYTRGDVDELARLVRETGAEMIVCTRKDLVKLRVPVVGGAPLRALRVQLHFLHGEAELASALAPLAVWAQTIHTLDVDDAALTG
jgi:tetraacyldisaccharide 4'-kinase